MRYWIKQVGKQLSPLSVHPPPSPFWGDIAITSPLFGPLLARCRWEHLAFRLIHEDLVAIHQAAAILTAVSDYFVEEAITAQSAVRRWASLVQNLTAFHRGRGASQLATEYYGAHSTPRP